MSAKRILVGLGLEACSEAATHYAVDIARRSGGELTGVTLIDTPSLAHVGPRPIGAGAIAQQLSASRTATAHRLAGRLAKGFRRACTAERVPFAMRCEEGEPLERLIAVARYHDVAIVGRDGLCEHGLMEEPLDGLVRLVSSGVRPMVVVPPEYRPIRRVLIAYSGSMESAKTLRRFVQLDLWPDAELTIIHFGPASEEGEKLVADAAEYCAVHGKRVEVELRPESARHALMPVAEELGFDLVVLGNSGRRLLVRRLFGQTMLHAVQNSELPLFLCQ